MDETYAGMPGWEKAFLAASVVLALLLVFVLLFAGGQHGPGRHIP